jgi:hypothetical protein
VRHFPFSQSARPDTLRTRTLSWRQLLLALPPAQEAAALRAHRIKQQQPPERWGARLARLGLLLVHCLLRPFLGSRPPRAAPHLAVDTRPMLQPRTQTPTAAAAPPTKSLVAAVFERLSMDMPQATAVASDSGSPTNSSSEPSPQAADLKPKTLVETKRAPSPPLEEAAPENQEEEYEQEHDDVEELQQTLLRKSTGSIAIMTRQQEALDHRRHTFSAMSADSRANMRRRSYDLTAQFGSTYPPSSPPQQPLPHSLKGHHHLQHLRVYGKSSGPAKRIGECHEEGAPLVALVTPNADTVWTRGKPVDIEWKVLDSTAHKLSIELMEDGLSATTLIAKDAPNSGFFTYHKVPWGMESGSKYFLRVSAAGDAARFRTSSFFQISSAP